LKKSTEARLPFGVSSPCRSGDPHQGAKVFCFFFSKKKTFLSSANPNIERAQRVVRISRRIGPAHGPVIWRAQLSCNCNLSVIERP
jgi:hypothetical protein